MFVLGEFYWQVKRGERVAVTDYVTTGTPRRWLSRERSADEVVWSAGESLGAEALAEGFGLQGAPRAALRRGASPLAMLGEGVRRPLRPSTILVLVLLLVVVVMLVRCSRDDCDEFRQLFGADSREYRECLRTARVSGSSGGSWGGYSSGGGGHK